MGKHKVEVTINIAGYVGHVNLDVDSLGTEESINQILNAYGCVAKLFHEKAVKTNKKGEAIAVDRFDPREEIEALKVREGLYESRIATLENTLCELQLQVSTNQTRLVDTIDRVNGHQETFVSHSDLLQSLNTWRRKLKNA